MRALLGSGPTALRGDSALRAREVSQAGLEELRAAEESVVVRHARPVEERPR